MDILSVLHSVLLFSFLSNEVFIQSGKFKFVLFRNTLCGIKYRKYFLTYVVKMLQTRFNFLNHLYI